MTPRRDLSPYALVVVLAAVRLAMQLVPMAPYDGLDERYHVARLAFVLHEHRNPTTSERSVPPYLLTNSRDVRPYLVPNYEAQQPSAYYSLVAPLALLAPAHELQVWRIASALFALVCVVATAAIGERWFGAAGIAAAALVPFIPTWESLVVRASNDAMACALVACAVAVTASSPKRSGIVAEALLWGAAIATKLYVWPVAVIVPFLWWKQRAETRRIVAVTAVSIVAAALTLADLAARTNSPIGVVVVQGAQRGALNVIDIVKVTIASAVWTSGQHFDAMKPLAMVLYALPVMIAIAIALRKCSGFTLQVSGLLLLAFALAQTANVVLGYVKNAQQIGGKEGWYWFVLTPILAPALLAPPLARFRWIAAWTVAWDIVITDCQLIPTWSGLTSAAHPSLLFRWGPMHLPPAWVIPFRAVQIAALAMVVRRA